MDLYTERLLLRPWREADAEDLYRYAQNPLVGPSAGWPVHGSVADSRAIIKEVLSAPETYAVCLKEDNIAIGSIGLIPPLQSHTAAAAAELEIGYWIGQPFWGRGLIPEAVKRLQEHAFRDLGCIALWCGYYDGNEKSKRCQEKCGFTYHHTEQDKPCPLMGDVRTEHFTRLTREQWEKANRDQTFYTSDRQQWRHWLAAHFETEQEVWFVFPMQEAGEASLTYNDAVEEALCFGWIDSTIKHIDPLHRAQRFTPRKAGSAYSRPNIERLIWLDAQGLLHPSLRDGLLPVIRAPFCFPADILAAIQENQTAWANYQTLPEPYKRIRVAYIDAARKRPAEFQKRLANFINKTRANKLIPGFGGIDKYYK